MIRWGFPGLQCVEQCAQELTRSVNHSNSNMACGGVEYRDCCISAFIKGLLIGESKPSAGNKFDGARARPRPL